MKLYISKGSGSGLTELSAFDTALLEAGIGNLNLIYLSSVIPIGSRIVHKNIPLKDKDFGSKLFCVLSEQRTSVPNEEVWAGIGWVQDKKDSRGLFVEHHGHSRESVENDIRASLEKMVASRPKRQWSEVRMVIEGRKCVDKPVSALVVAAYKVARW